MLILYKNQEKGLSITEDELRENKAIKTKEHQQHSLLASKPNGSQAPEQNFRPNRAITYTDNLGTSTTPRENSLKKAVVVVKRLTTKESTVSKKEDKDYSVMKRQFELLQQQLDQLKQKLADKEEGEDADPSPTEEDGTNEDGLSEDGDGEEEHAAED